MRSKDFKEIVTAYEKLIFTVCYQLVNNYEDARNLTQDTFISAFTHIDSCHMESIKPWLCRIATNKAKDYLKSAYNNRVQLLDEDSQLDVPTRDNQPEDIYLISEGESFIKKHILALKEPYHKVSVMYFLEEKTIWEIATVLKRPEKTVRTQLTRAKNILKEIISEEDRNGDF
ncbi:MAG: RNA polymerase sigma factor [Anaerotignaceae bacterium]